MNAMPTDEVHNWKVFCKQQREVVNARSALTPRTRLNPPSPPSPEKPRGSDL